jgi:ATP/maltotriose-dependent transcriptional regulator MalT
VSVDALAGPMVGRETELSEIEAQLDGLTGSASACVALEGEPGIGKTRLLAELRNRAEARGCLVLSGAAAEFERDLPFSVWTDALDAYVASQELGLDRSWPPDLFLELGEILPSQRPPGLGSRGSLADERYRSHRAMRRLLEQLAADRPVVLTLDDLHWSDGASIELISALLRRGPEAPVLLALAYRRGQAPEGLAAALAVRTARRIGVGELTENEAVRLLGDIDPKEAATIYRHGGGNPFYLEQLARGSDGGLLQAAPNGNGRGVPAAVAASLSEELLSLSPLERMVLQAAAVAGEPFEPDLAAAIAEVAPAEGLTALDALLAHDLVRPTAVPRRFAFRHPLVRRAVYDGAPGGWRLAAHARAAAAMAARGAPPAELAHHVEQSASQGDETAVRQLLAAGMASAARAPAAAARWFEAALRLLPDADRRRQVDVRVALASALRSTGELERCRATLLDAIELLGSTEAHDPRRTELTVRCAGVEHWLGRHGDAHLRLERAWEELADRTTATAAGLQIELSVDGLYELDLDQALTMGRGARATARTTDDATLLATAASALALAEAAAGDIEPAHVHRDEAAGLIDRFTDTELGPRLEALYYLGWAENYLERYDAAIAHADRGIAIARSIGEGRLLVPLMLVKGYPFEMQGRVAEAIELCEAAVEATRLSVNPHYLFWALFELSFAHYHAGDLEAAIAAGEESARVGGRLSGGTMPAAGGGPGWVLAMSHFEAGRTERAHAMMRELGPDDLPHKIPVERCFDWEVLALVELALGRVDAAEAFVVRAEENARRLGLRLPDLLARRARAAVLLEQGDAVGAARLAGESAELAGHIGARLVGAFALSLQGRALSVAGERSEAIAVLRRAESELDQCGSVRVRDEARRELRKLGARAETRGPAAGADSGVGALTGRELEIARLVTDRKTNREIAAELFLSDKTIESHLRNIFVKLGVSSRVEVARAVERAQRENGDMPG